MTDDRRRMTDRRRSIEVQIDSVRCRPSSVLRKKVEASVARCIRTPPDEAYPVRALRSVFQTALRSQSNRSIVVIGKYGFGPITPEPSRAKARLLRPRRSYFDPVSGGLKTSSVVSPPELVESPGTAPGSERFITTPVYRHSWLAPALRNIGANGCRKKSRVRPQETHVKSP